MIAISCSSRIFRYYGLRNCSFAERQAGGVVNRWLEQWSMVRAAGARPFFDINNLTESSGQKKTRCGFSRKWGLSIPEKIR
jgi:hypothetical protein